VIGKPIAFSIEGKTPNKDYGIVWVGNDQLNVANLIVADGWAKVRLPPNATPPYRPELEQLVQLEEEAKKDKKGVWTQDKEELKTAIRKIPSTQNVPEVYEKLKGKPLSGVLEYVRTGSSLRITLLPTFHDISLNLSGVECPGMDKEGTFEPFGREAKFFTEHYLLNRDVTVVLEGVDKYNCYGTVTYGKQNIAVELLKVGLGKFVDWSAHKSPANEEMRAAESAAKKAKLRIWAAVAQDHKPVTKEERKQPKVGREIVGIVTDIVHAGFIKVTDTGKNEHKIFLSSIRIPRNGNFIVGKKEDKKEEVEATIAWEAREIVRKRLIGQRVRCVVDYLRTPEQQQLQQNAKPDQKLETKQYASVYVDKQNVAVELVEKGLASAAEHRGTDLRSKDYEQIILAESRAKKSTKGLWQNFASAPILRLNDLTVETKSARGFSGSLKRSGRTKGVVEREFSGSHLKVYIPKENCQIAFSLAGIRCPKRSDDFGEEAKEFTADKVHLRDVEVEILGFVEKNGTFVGNVYVNRENLSIMLLEEGLAQVNYGSLRDLGFGNDYLHAEEAAKNKKKNVWTNYDAEKEAKKKTEEKEKESKKPNQEIISVLVTEILDGTNFYVQIVGPDAEQLENIMKGLATEEDTGVYVPVINELVKAQFTADDSWYRAKIIEKIDDTYRVLYVDYGNEETIGPERIRRLDPQFAKLAAQAHKASLAFIKSPGTHEDYGREAADYLKEMVWGKSMLASVESRDAGNLSLSLYDRETDIHVNLLC